MNRVRGAKIFMKHMAHILTAVVLLILIGVGPLGARAQETASPTVVAYVLSKARDEGSRAGTAFHIGGGRFFTNGHIVEAISPNSFWGPEGWWTEGTLWAMVPGRISGYRVLPGEDTFGPAMEICKDPRWRGIKNGITGPYDLASFKIASVDLPAYHLASVDAKVGDRVRGEGYASASRAWPPKMYSWSGTVSEIGDGWMWIAITEGFNMRGDSGGPILNESGDVVAVLYGGDYPDNRTPAKHALAVPLSGIQSSACR